MNREGKKCVLYPRVSTEMQVDGYSLEGQKNGLKRFADREEMEIVGIYEDAGKSGKSIEGRPAFKKMLSDIGNGLEIDYILVYKLSRFGRNAADILNSLEYVQSYGVNLICIEEGIDSSQTSGKLLISVLSAVAEIERENIIEQTMNGRREKARQGGWNGGFAPYGYYLKDNQLLIEESEAAAIRIIFEKFAGSDIGYGGIAKYLNLQGIKKIPRQNGTLENWSGHLVRQILDNPVYCGKIAYGRRTREKVKGTKNEYKQVHAEDYILEDGQHEGIVSEELWQKVHAKRVATGIKQPSKTGKDRSHLLTGVLKCPLCGSPMYTNKHAWTNKDGTYKEVYYYICGRNKQERGHYCEYKASLRKTDIEPLVIEAIRELVSDKSFAKEIKKRFGVQTDTSKIDKELANYESKLKEVDLNKARLEREIDNLPADAKYRERKIHDMTIRLDGLYDTIVELEERIEDAKLRRSSIEMEAITLENVYRIMENFSKLYAIISDEEKKSLVSYLIKEIQIYPNGTSDRILKSIEFNFPIYRDGREIRKLLWENGNTVETVEVPAQNANTEASRDTASESTANDSGAESQESNEADTTTITQTVLTIHLTHKTPEEMQTAYNFTARQAEYLPLLQDPEYETLWAELLGGFAAGSSEILMPDTTHTPTGTLQWPLPIPGSITSPFGYRTDPLTGETSYHDGTDIAVPESTPILADADGTVTVANALDSWGGSYGYYVQIDHSSGLQTLYAHCSQICVTQGQQVQAGQVIAYVGHTGRATGNHLHFEVRENGERVDAMSYYQ